MNKTQHIQQQINFWKSQQNKFSPNSQQHKNCVNQIKILSNKLSQNENKLSQNENKLSQNENKLSQNENKLSQNENIRDSNEQKIDTPILPIQNEKKSLRIDVRPIRIDSGEKEESCVNVSKSNCPKEYDGEWQKIINTFSRLDKGKQLNVAEIHHETRIDVHKIEKCIEWLLSENWLKPTRSKSYKKVHKKC